MLYTRNQHSQLYFKNKETKKQTNRKILGWPKNSIRYYGKPQTNLFGKA